MKTGRVGRIVQENLRAYDAQAKNNRARHLYPRMCWKCQQDKPQQGGHLRIYPGLSKFVCEDCLNKN